MMMHLSPDSFEKHHTFVSEIEKKELMPSVETWQKSLQSDQPLKGCKNMVAEGEKLNNNDPCLTNIPTSSIPKFVYHRRKNRRNSATTQTCVTNTRNSDNSLSVISSDTHSIRAVDSPSGEEAPCNPQPLDTCCIIDSCSPSKFNEDLNSVPNGENLDECSSSANERSKRTRSISIFYHRKRLRKVGPICKVCEYPENKLKMIVCDNCNHAFHLACCKPVMENIPEDKWVCNSCTKKKQKSEIEKSSGNTPGRISFMLKDSKGYTPRARVGSEFQAVIPDWSGPIVDDDVGRGGEPLEVTEVESMLDWNCKRGPSMSSIGNWIQCREIIGVGEGDDETICGKWRRAPVFEVQTDNWECFRSILWDPYHADCAVPQELDTEEVMKQLKYMELLKPKLAAKRRKVDRTKTGGGAQA